ncbi:MAG TPA: hypothetical protein VIY48_09450 [Candidatus Paceibacterota bacterium]
MKPADTVEGRFIHMAFDVTLFPEQTEHLGDTDAAMDYGRQLIREAMLLIQMVAQAEGFRAEIEASNTVY